MQYRSCTVYTIYCHVSIVCFRAMGTLTLWFSLWIVSVAINFSAADMFDKNVFYADDGNDRTVAMTMLPNKEKKEFQHAILNFMGLEEAPKPTLRLKDVSVPAYMLDLYETLLRECETPGSYKQTHHGVGSFVSNQMVDLTATDLIMSFVDRETREQTNGNILLLSFDVSDVHAGDKLIGAELRVHRNQSRFSDHCHDLPCRVIVDAKNPSGIRQKKLSTLSSVAFSDLQGGWIALNVTSALTYWLLNPTVNPQLELRIETASGSPVSLSSSGIEGAFMVGFFKGNTEVPRPRQSRSRDKRSPGGGQTSVRDPSRGHSDYDWDNNRLSRRSCQKRTLYVSFRDLGWQDWIIAPDGYAAYYCAGECSFPLNSHMNATNHAIVQTLVHLMDPHRAPKPCCAPSQLDPISVLYFDDFSNVVLKKYNNMVVRTCGCH